MRGNSPIRRGDFDVNFQVRPTELRDHAVCSALMLRLDFRHREFDRLDLSVGQLRSIIASEHEVMLMIDRAIGFVHASDSNSPYATAQDQMYLNNLYVIEEARRIGCGTQLMLAAFDWGRERGMSRIRLHVWSENNAARKFYGRLGFKPVGNGLERDL